MSDIYLTSDLHFYHANVIKYCNRPFTDVEHMNESLINNWNSVVKPDDQIIVVGDFSLAFRPVEVITPRLNGVKFLVPGNHDFCHSYNKKSRKPEKRGEWIKKYQDNGWNVLSEQCIFDIPEIGTANICHIPWNNNDPRYEKHKAINDNKWLLHGHIHSNTQLNLDKKMIDIGCDANNYTPVHLDKIKELINEII
jgi:calcineurin-like phosphoesterase family protein